MVCFTTRDWLACRSVRLERPMCKSDSRQDIWWRHAEQLEAESDKRVAQFFVAARSPYLPPRLYYVPFPQTDARVTFFHFPPGNQSESEWEGWRQTKWHFCFFSLSELSFSSLLCSREATSQKRVSFPYWNCGEPLCWSTVHQRQRKVPKNYP